MRVTPRASRTVITGMIGNGTDTMLKIALAAPSVVGKANEELIAYFAGIFGVARSQMEVVAGKQSKNKVIRIKAKSADEIAAALARFFPDNRPWLP